MQLKLIPEKAKLGIAIDYYQCALSFLVFCIIFLTYPNIHSARPYQIFLCARVIDCATVLWRVEFARPDGVFIWAQIFQGTHMACSVLTPGTRWCSHRWPPWHSYGMERSLCGHLHSLFGVSQASLWDLSSSVNETHSLIHIPNRQNYATLTWFSGERTAPRLRLCS